jgi:hypothetical protein
VAFAAYEFYGQAASAGVGAFAKHAWQAHAAGLCVLPTAADDAKRPLVRGWTRAKAPPRPSTVAKWADQFPDANLGYRPAASGLVVLDLDDFKQEDKARRLLGIEHAPVIVATRRGLHIPLRSRPIPGFDLRRHGIAGEIKGVGSFVVGPGSLHPTTGLPYRFVMGDWQAFAQVPRLDQDRLADLRDVRPEAELSSDPNLEGARNNGLFRHLRELSAAGILTSREQTREAALTYNLQHNDPPEPERKAIATADSVWRMSEAGRCRAPKSNRALHITDREYDALRGLDTAKYDHADALALLLSLKRAHAARSRGGELFAIAATAMARDRVIPGWTDRKRYLRATAALVSVGLIAKVKAVTLTKWTDADGRARATGRSAAQYRFTTPTHSEKDRHEHAEDRAHA